jgi:anti-sigma B factor antagonist
VPIINSKVQDGLLTVCVTDEPQRVRLALQGDLDLANAKTAEAQLMGAFESGKEVLVDLGKLEFLDSTGIALLVMALRRHDGGQLRFLPSETAGVRRLFTLTGLDQKLPFATEAIEPTPLVTGLQPAA